MEFSPVSPNPLENFEIIQFQNSLRRTLLQFPSEMLIMQSSLNKLQDLEINTNAALLLPKMILS